MAFSKSNPYTPSFLRSAVSGSRPLVMTGADVADTNIAATTSSFIYDSSATPMKSTQQLNVDWSQFQNHTFFMSAEAKVNLAFDAIVNNYPFDGTRQEAEVFFEGMTGFDKWVFDNFPTWQGELAFSGCTGGKTLTETGTYIAVQNRTAALFPELARNTTTGQPVLNPTGSTSMTIEMQLYLPAAPNDVQTVCQMMNGPTQGYSFYLTSSTSTSSVEGRFSIVSGSSFMTVPVELTKGAFNHVAFVLNRDNGLPYLESFLLSQPVAEAPQQVELGDMQIDNASFLIGSGTQVTLGTAVVTPKQTFSGTLDEFRIFFSARTPSQMAAYAAKALYSTPDLVLYYRFNEPPPPITTGYDNIVLDSSGNSLHALINNFTGSLRRNAAADTLNPVVYERADSVHVLFPAYPPVVSFNSQLMMSASAYDQENPNLITKLVPQHYLLDGAAQDGFNDPITGNENLPFVPAAGAAGVPGQGMKGNVQILVSLLYIWARFFDEMKLFIDQFSSLRTVDYDTGNVAAFDTVPDNFLLDLVKRYGFNLPPLFNDSTIEQYVRGENVDIDQITTNTMSLKQVQNSLLRRVLVNLPDVLKSKGTQHSIRSFLRAVGIDPGNNVRIREFGGPTTQNMTFARMTKIEPGGMVQFTTSSVASSPFLSASRVEPGFPTLDVHGTGSNGLLTSGSWTWEGIVKFTPASIDLMQSATQSLARFCVTGSVSGSANGSVGIVANLLAISSSVQPKLVLYVRPGDAASSPMLRLELDTPAPGYTDATDLPPSIFNYDKWNVSFGRQRSDDPALPNSEVSSSYFLRLAYQNDGRVEFMETTASFFQEAPRQEHNVLQSLTSGSSLHGPFIEIGNRQIVASGTGSQYPHLNDYSVAPAEARVTDFNGRMSNVRFWSRALSTDEWTEHVRNYTSVGVEDPKSNWNYVNNVPGSFGRLRMNTMVQQGQTTANPDGTLALIDFSESNLGLAGRGFPTDVQSVVGEIFDYSYLSPYFDEASSDEKVRIRSFNDFALVEQTPWAAPAPVHEVVPSEQPTDDVRFIIEFSLIDALNRDIIAIFATFDAMDNAMGAPELVFSPDYPDLELLRTIYFNRIKDKLNFQAFFEFFRWFDSSIGTFIQQLIPRKTRFKGTNFTIESHMLERPKQEYFQYDIYLGDSNRANLGAEILLQQFSAVLGKY